MVVRLGTPTEGLQRRQSRMESLKRVETEIESLTRRSHRSMMDLNQGQRMEVQRRTDHQHRQQPQSANLEQLYHEALPTMDKALSHSGPAGFVHDPDTASVISFTSSIHSLNYDSASVASSTGRRLRSMRSSGATAEDIDSKIECVNSLVSLLGCTDVEKMSKTFLAMSSSPANCDLMRSHRVVPLLVQLLHGPRSPDERVLEKQPREVRLRVAKSLHNMVHAHPADKQCKREAKVLRLLETLRMYADLLHDICAASPSDFQMQLMSDSAEEKECDEQENIESLKRALSNCHPVKVRVTESASSRSGKDIVICGKNWLLCFNFLSRKFRHFVL